ncbi:MAG TPA: rhodanese-like domain-containing protein [Gemmatimonadales bacterium]|nr:rhodanese-like domain-containing protein [Gemmatimonadales bacterium]
MIAPFFDGSPALTAVPIGFAFGATLERAGLGSARTIADQLTGRDFTVVKVMFSCIVTAMLLVFWADRLGWLDLTRVALPTTDVLPQLAGSVLFGAGFALASLCPGTACVAAAVGARDGLVTIGGLFLGTLLTGELWPRLGGLAVHAVRDDARLPGDLGLSTGVVVALIVGAALLTFWIAGRIEGAGGRTEPGPRAPWQGPLATAAAVLALLAAATGSSRLPGLGQLQAIAGDVDHETDHVDALTLAQWIHDRHRHLRILDVRDGLAFDDYRIPGAEDVPVQQIPTLSIAASDTLVIYSDGGGHAAQAWMLLRLRGVPHAYILRDGLEAWEEDVLAPRVPFGADSATLARFASIKSLSAYFGGRPSTAPAILGVRDTTGSVAQSPPKRRKTC